jgi:hypothetical protein
VPGFTPAAAGWRPQLRTWPSSPPNASVRHRLRTKPSRAARADALEFLKETNQTGPRSTQNSKLKKCPASISWKNEILDLDIVLYFATFEGGEALVKRGANHRAGHGNFSVN